MTRLLEAYKQPTAGWQFQDISALPSMAALDINGEPAPLVLPDGDLYVFAIGLGGHLLQGYKQPNAGWTVIDVTAQPGMAAMLLESPPTPLQFPNGDIAVYGASGGSDLLEASKAANGDWTFLDITGQSGMGGMSANSRPTPLLFPNGDLHVYAVGTNAHLLEAYKPAGAGWTVSDISAQPGMGALTTADPPAGLLFDNGDLHVYVTGTNSHLLEGYKRPSAAWTFIDITGEPGMGYMAPSGPTVPVLFPSGDLHVYGVGGNGHMLEGFKRPNLGWAFVDITAEVNMGGMLSYLPPVPLLLPSGDLHLYALNTAAGVLEGYKQPNVGWQFIDITAEPGMGAMRPSEELTAIAFASGDIHVYGGG